MRLAVRRIYHKPVIPSCEVIELDDETWKKFLYGDNMTRKTIVCRAIGKENMVRYTREIAWFPLESQEVIEKLKRKL